jgi:hypothetical protein
MNDAAAVTNKDTSKKAPKKKKGLSLPIQLVSIIRNNTEDDSNTDLSQAVRTIEGAKKRELSSYLRVVCMRTSLID